MHTSLLGRACAALVAAGTLVAFAGTGPAGSAPGHPSDRAASGTITGKVKTAPASKRDVFAPTAYVTRLDVPGSIVPAAVSSKGTFKVKVPAGLYSVVTSDYAKKAPKDDATLVTVRAGKKVKAREVALRAGDLKVSVGGFVPGAGVDASGKYFVQGLDGLVITDLLPALGSTASCDKDVNVYEDRKYGRFKDVLKELKLQTTKYFSPQDRANARKALKNLPKYTPTVRVTGTVTSLAAGASTAQFRVVEIKTGKVLFSKDVTSSSAFDLSVDGAAAVAKYLCGVEDETVPETLTGTFSGSVTTSSQTLTWSGTVTKSFVEKDPVTGSPYAFEAHYGTTAATMTWQLTGRCTGGGTLGIADMQTAFYDSTIDWTSTPGKGWAYELGLSPKSQMLAPCPPDEDGNPTPPYNAAGLVGGTGSSGGALMYTSDTRGPETNRYSGDGVAYRGSLSINPGYAQTWVWDLVGAGEVPVPDQD